jgi:hypothetical protein
MRLPNPGRRARRIQRFPAARTYRSTPGIISPVSRIRSGNGSSGARHCGDRSVRAPVPARRMVTVSGDSAWPWQDPEQEQEWLRQLSLIYSGLIGIGVVMVAPFLTAASLDLSAMVCVVAFSVAIPILAALVVLNRQEAFRRRMTKSFFVEAARAVAQGCAFVGVVAGFWHITWIAGVGMLAGGLVAVAVQTAGFARLERDRLLERDQKPTPQEGDEPGGGSP